MSREINGVIAWARCHVGIVLAAAGVAVFIISVFVGTFRVIDDRLRTDRFLKHQVLVNDLDQVDHRIAEKEQARCQEQFIRDIVNATRVGADLETVHGCFGPHEAARLDDLYAKREALLRQLENHPL